MNVHLKTGGGNIGWKFESSSQHSAEKLLGNVIGGFRLSEVLACSQQSWVYLARRSEGQLNHDVVVKLLPPALRTESQLELFEREKQMLCRLSHPGIATFIDAGITEDDCSYIVMEYIRGESIAQYCDRRRLTIKQRVSLIIGVLDILKFAHSHLILHRDIKPSNILVTEDGYIKLLDFGIGKLMADTANVVDEQLLFTPQYASPEQLFGEDINITTDIYQVGVVLYELLVDGFPYKVELEHLAALDARMQKGLIRPPSIYFKEQQSRFYKNRVAMQRSIAPKRGMQLLDTDIDGIVLKALSRSSEDRYQSIDIMARDLSLWLAQRPISLFQNQWRYRISKLVLRNRRLVTASALFVLLLTLGGVNYFVDLHSEQQRTKLQAEKAEHIAGFLTDILLKVDNTLDNTQQPTMVDLINYATRQLSGSTSMSADVRRTLVMILANAYGRLQKFEEAKQVFEEHSGVLDILAGTQATDAELMVEYAEALYDLGEYGQATSALKRVFDEDIKPSLTYPSDYKAYKIDAEMSRKSGKYQRALTNANEALRIHILNQGGAEQGRNIYNLIGGININLGQLDKALEAFELSLSLSKSVGEGSTYGTLILQSNMAILYNMVGNTEAAETLVVSTIGKMRESFNERHSSIAGLLNTYSMVLKAKGELELAVARVKESIELYETHFGKDYHKLASPYLNLSSMKMAMGDCEEAKVVYEEAQRLNLLQTPDKPLSPFKCDAEQVEDKLF